MQPCTPLNANLCQADVPHKFARANPFSGLTPPLRDFSTPSPRDPKSPLSSGRATRAMPNYRLSAENPIGSPLAPFFKSPLSTLRPAEACLNRCLSPARGWRHFVSRIHVFVPSLAAPFEYQFVDREAARGPFLSCARPGINSRLDRKTSRVNPRACLRTTQHGRPLEPISGVESKAGVARSLKRHAEVLRSPFCPSPFRACQ